MSSTTLGLTRSSIAPGPSDRVAHLGSLGASGRLAHYRAGKLDLADLSIWAARYPEEVPTVNGEVEWIGLTLADLD
jgi:hypothetical protein